MSKVIVQRLEHVADIDTIKHYSEPFIGGGSVLTSFFKDKIGKIESISINDKDIALACLWTSVIRYPNELVQKVRGYTPSAEYFYSTKKELLSIDREPHEIDILDLGFKKLVLHQISYSGLGTQAGGPIGGKHQLGEYKVDCRWSEEYLSRKIRVTHELLSSFKITEDRCTANDFQQVLQHPSSVGSLVYLDPPYYIPGNALYQEGFSCSDHERLSQILHKACFSWVLSYDNCPEITKFYSWARIEQVNRKYTLNNNECPRSELLISNDIYLPSQTNLSRIQLYPYEYLLCHRTSLNYATKFKSDGHYNNGCVNSAEDKRVAERTGLLGEMAFGKYLGLRVNLKHETSGNRIDFRYCNYNIDVKTNTKGNNRWYVRVHDDDKAKEKNIRRLLTCDIYVFVNTERDKRERLEAILELAGWMWKSEIEKIVPKRAPKHGSKHWNYEIFRNNLHSIEELWKLS
jgi:DNA adenine methylase